MQRRHGRCPSSSSSRELPIHAPQSDVTHRSEGWRLVGGDARLVSCIIEPPQSAPPRWIEFFGTHIDPRDFLSASASAALVVPSAGRLFALTFGYGRHLLEPGSYEEDFGLRATLNSVSPDQIRTVDRKALDSSGRHSREQASRNIPIIEFGLDVDKDILRAVTGPPEDSRLGKRLAGADCLSVVVDVELEDLRQHLSAYLTQFRKRVYQSRFPWVNNIREVRDPDQGEQLDADLESRIRGQQLERIWIAVPDLVDWHDVAGFTYSRAGRSDLLDDVSIESYLATVRRPGETSVASLRHHRVFCISAETDTPRADWPVYKCIYAETERSGRTFLLNGGRWYEVAATYVQEVNQAIRAIHGSTQLRLPEFEDANETEYNERVARSDPRSFALMDRRLVRYGGGSSQVEFCDLYSRRKELVHVKRYGGSGTLSHLFAQGSVSASLFLNDQKFREDVNRKLPASHKLAHAGAQVRSSDYEVAYVIASKADGPLVLPFFSRVTLRSAYTQLRNMGFRVTLTKVQCRQ